jgi:hypothetical protein
MCPPSTILPARHRYGRRLGGTVLNVTVPGCVEEAVVVKRSVCSVVMALLVLLTTIPLPAVRAQEPAWPSVDGIQLVRTTAETAELFYDPDVDPAVVATSQAAIIAGFTDVPELTGLPPLVTPVRAFVLADDERFRLALAEIGRVRTDLVAEEIGGYTIERDGVMLIFFAAANVEEPASATLGFEHELAHLAVREATQRRPMPQWFNEGYASWIASQALARKFPAESALQRKLDRLAVGSALHTRGMIPWSDLVTRARFSRAGVDGLVNLAYGQSTLFIEYLAIHHGVPALARFLTEIGGGAGATQAFGTAFGAFGPTAVAYEQHLRTVGDEFPPALYGLQRATETQPAVFGLAGGPALETAVVTLLVDGETIRRREIDLDGAGLMVVSLPKSLLDGPGVVRVRVTVPVLGALQLDPNSDDSDFPILAPSAAPTPLPQPSPAPAQLPAA